MYHYHKLDYQRFEQHFHLVCVDRVALFLQAPKWCGILASGLDMRKVQSASRISYKKSIVMKNS